MPLHRPKVLICDDSPLLRTVLRDLMTEGGLEVVGETTDGADLLDAVRRLRPDVVTLDVEMARMDGLSALRVLMHEQPTPVVMVSTLTGTGTRETVTALAIGAVDAVQKPALRLTPQAWGATRDELVAKVINASRARVGRIAPPPARPRPAAAAAAQAAATLAPASPGVKAGAAKAPASAAGRGEPLVIIATSTGGPRALHELVPRLPARLGAGVLLVQHMPVGFTKSLAERLDAESPLIVREARRTDTVRPDTVLIAPAGSHLEVTGHDAVRLSDAPAVGGLRPRADITIETAVKNAGRPILLVVLTGMGMDGLEGARALKAAGAGTILTEDEKTCVIYGMPRSVDKAGLSDASFPIDAMHRAIGEAVTRMARRR